MISPLRQSILTLYGGAHPQCTCPGCGVSDLTQLELHHRYGDGGWERETTGLRGEGFYRALLTQPRREDLVILCRPCNLSAGQGETCQLDHTPANALKRQAMAKDTPNKTKGKGRAVHLTSLRKRINVSFAPDTAEVLMKLGRGKMGKYLDELIRNDQAQQVREPAPLDPRIESNTATYDYLDPQRYVPPSPSVPDAQSLPRTTRRRWSLWGSSS